MILKKFLILNLAVLLFFSCGKRSENFNNEIKSVKAAAVYEKEIPDEASGFGSLSFLSKVDITSSQEAVINKLFFREGDFVNQGNIIIQLENPQINIAVERAKNNYTQVLAACNLANSRLLEGIFQAEAQLLALDKAFIELSLAKRKWEENNRKHQNQETLFLAGGVHTEAILAGRFSIDTEWEQIQLMERELEIRRIGYRDQDLKKAGLSVPLDETERNEAFITLLTATLRAELEASYARLEAAEKELESINIALDELTIRSPSSGVVGARYLEEGERVRQQDKIISIIDTTSLYAIFPIREKDALRIEKGMKASVLIDGTGDTRNGIVDLIYPQADSQSLSFLVRVLLNDRSQNRDEYDKLKPGMFARITVTMGLLRKAVFIPESAIFNLNNNDGSVFILNGSVVSERKIILGFSNGDEREIKEGLKEGDVIVLRPNTDLREGTSVAILE
ncbi:MAG: efflux RND transporter periplasmic adaptor subunit [Treponema sp.]|nr:efflux RND transporter periplasmic adaptor subunit [Treponema sp.]MCL2250619.1 efflux RND transporter periplasmic adaptor subunit [Treponema sp.]